ncbi:MAG: hypothetical protein WD226_02140 [Planctomycetota bacterium]
MRPFRSSLLLLLAAPALVAAVPLIETQLKANDHGKVGKDVAAYFTARSENKNINEAFNDAAETVEKTAKKVKDTDILALVEDWEAILAEATTTFLDHEEYRKKGKLIDDYEGTSGDMQVAGALYCPKSYSARRGEPLPLILIVPDENMSTREALEIQWTNGTNDGPALLLALKMPADTRIWDVIGSPPSEIGGISAVMLAYGHLNAEFKIDVNRVFVAGHGRGIGTAVATAAAFPHVFAGVIGRQAAPEGMHYQNLGNLPSLFVSGGTHATALKTALSEMGAENCTTIDGTEDVVWEWIADKRRDAYPSKVHFEPTSNYAVASNWLSLVGVAVEQNAPVVDASFDRASNTITIDAKHATKVHVYFNDILADLAKPVVVKLNGQVHEQVVGRNQKTLLDLAYQSGDWGRVFVNRQTFDVPATADETADAGESGE